jgi:transposase-like protein
MTEAILNEARFTNENAAREHLEMVRWPLGPICPHCAAIDRQSRLNGQAHRPGVLFCGHCREQYTVTVGTVFERSKVPLHKWLAATHLLCASKKGMSSKQIERMLGVTYKTAWFMTHRIREAMRPASLTPMGQGGGGVEIDETYIGNDKTKPKPKNGPARMHRVLALVDRESGRAQSMVMETMNAKQLVPILRANIAKEAHVMTDSNRSYNVLDVTFNRHDSVNHSIGEYVSFTKPNVHTNTIEGFFSIFKRGMKGTYQHCGKQHLHRYLAEFDFRYSERERLGVNDSKRADKALKGISGKRLTYRRIDA